MMKAIKKLPIAKTTVYKLACGSCNKNSYVSCSSSVMEWKCGCGKVWVSSLPIDKSGKLITDPKKSPNIVNSAVSGFLKNVVKGKPK